MSQKRFLTLVIAALVVIGTALFFSNRRNPTEVATGAALFPSLSAQLPAVTQVTIRKGAATPLTTVHKVGEQWGVQERGDYPADLSKLRKLLMTLRDAKIVEEKTSDPARYAEIGVEESAQASATGTATEITVTAPAATFGVIVGKTVGEGNFVRRSGEKTSYSVEPAISLETEPRYWIEARLLDIPATKIRAIEYQNANSRYAIRQGPEADAHFTLEGAPKGRKPLEAAALAPSPNTLTALDAEDVASSSSLDFGNAARVLVTLSDGVVWTLTGIVVDTKHWVQLAASQDALSAKFKGRAFEIASYRYDGLFKPLDQYLVAPETAAPKGALKGLPTGPKGKAGAPP
jgi:hypothetical protein